METKITLEKTASIDKTKVKYLNDSDLLLRFGRLVQTERKITHLVIECIAEIDSRKLYLERAFSSIYDFLITGHGYSESAAGRRIESAKLLREFPEIAPKIESGALNLSQISTAAKSFRQAEKSEGQKLDVEQKKELLAKIEYSTHRQTELIIAQEFNLPIPVEEREKIHRDQSITLTINFTKEEMEILRQVKDLVSHSAPDNGWNKVIMYLANKEFNHRTKIKKENVKPPQPLPRTATSSTSATSSRKSIRTSVKKFILARDKCCQYKDPLTGKVCGSTRYMQDDHIQPVWAGGTNEPENLQILCAEHNRLKYHKEAGLR